MYNKKKIHNNFRARIQNLLNLFAKLCPSNIFSTSVIAWFIQNFNFKSYRNILKIKSMKKKSPSFNYRNNDVIERDGTDEYKKKV